jgi:hypothetical protein
MRKRFYFLSTGLVLLALLRPAWSQAPGRRQGTLDVGDLAPDFALQGVEGKQTVKLSKLVGKPVVLIFGSCT